MIEIELTEGMEKGRSEPNHTRLDNGLVQRYARAAGALYLVIIVIGVLGEAVIRSSLVVSHDATATAQRKAQTRSSSMPWRTCPSFRMRTRSGQP